MINKIPSDSWRHGERQLIREVRARVLEANLRLYHRNAHEVNKAVEPWALMISDWVTGCYGRRSFSITEILTSNPFCQMVCQYTSKPLAIAFRLFHYASGALETYRDDPEAAKYMNDLATLKLYYGAKVLQLLDSLLLPRNMARSSMPEEPKAAVVFLLLLGMLLSVEHYTPALPPISPITTVSKISSP
jgi:hypothetical protein